MRKVYYFASLFLTLLGSVAFSSCESDDEGYSGDSFDDVPSSYILSPDTKPSSRLPQRETGGSVYLIRNSSDLKLFIDMVCEGASFGDYATIELTHDLSISEKYEWTPLGNALHPLSVHIDGKGHTIEGTLNIKHSAMGPDEEVDGEKYGTTLYGFIGFGVGDVCNLNLKLDLLFHNFNVSVYPIIGILGGVITSNINDVNVAGDIKMEGTTRIHGYETMIGGVAGKLLYGAMTKCSAKGNIVISNHPLQERDYAMQMDYAYIGGLVGNHYQGQSSSCISEMDIELENCAIKNHLGIGGYMGKAAYHNVPVINDFTNHGDFKLTNIRKLSSDKEQFIAVGGVFGINESTTLAPVNVINTGDIEIEETSHSAYAGGFEGFHQGGDLTTGINEGDITNSAKRGYTGGCYGLVIQCDNNRNPVENKGNIKSTIFIDDRTDETGGLSKYTKGISGYTGGIAGAIVIGSVSNSTNYGDITAPTPIVDGVQLSLAGAIVGDGEYDVETCLNYGAVNGKK